MTTGMRRAAVAALVATFLVALPTPPPADAAKAPSPAPKLKALVKQTKRLPDRATEPKQDRKLTAAAVHASKVAKKKPCKAISDLERYRGVLEDVKVRDGKRFASMAERIGKLGPLSIEASQRLLAGRGTKRCGGGVRPSNLPQVETTVLQSDENQLSVRIELPELNFSSETGGGQVWTKLNAPNTDSPAAPGSPGIPNLTSQFGVPDGANIEVQTSNVTSYSVDGVDVFPAQPDPVDGLTQPPNFLAGPFADAPFTINKAVYGKGGFVPSDPGDAAIAGVLRDVTTGGLSVTSAQYNAKAETLKVIKSLNVSITFAGGAHTFSEELGLPWERPQQRILSTFLNRNIFDRFVSRYIPRRCGEEMLVITNPSTRAAADTFAAAKRAQGMRTSVFETGASPGIGTTATEIQAFIRSRLSRFLCIHPSYVTILGDDDLVPTFPGINGIASDLQYSMRDDADELPDVAVGRILGNDLTAVNNAVTKIVGYETTPLPGPVLGKAAIAAQFQDDNLDGRENRTFIQFAETVRNGLVGRGVAVDRIYGTHPGDDPQQFNDGTNLPAELKKPTFEWNGTGADVSNAWNDGRFLVIHRDHGWSDGWGTPGYSTANVQALTNGSNLPVVMSINCSSGAYDYDETSFASEALVKANGGAVGVFGDTRDSPSWHNTQIGLGFVDGLLPTVLPSEGPSTKLRTGDALINGKLRLAGLSPPATDGSTRNELYLWHYFGDPSMKMWGGGSPLVLDPSLISAQFVRQAFGPGPDPAPYSVHVTVPEELNGQPVSLLRNGDVVGKANIVGGQADIPADFGGDSPSAGELQVAVDADDSPPVQAPVSGVPTRTSLSQTCPSAPVAWGGQLTTSGTLSPGFAGAQIVVKYTPPDGATFERTVTTNADGNWSDTVTPLDHTSVREGNWKIQARFAGDSQRYPSTASECTVFVFDNS